MAEYKAPEIEIRHREKVGVISLEYGEGLSVLIKHGEDYSVVRVYHVHGDVPKVEIEAYSDLPEVLVSRVKPHDDKEA